MIPTGLLIIVLFNQGYWTGGQDPTINVNRAARQALPQAQLHADAISPSIPKSLLPALQVTDETGVLALAQWPRQPAGANNGTADAVALTLGETR